MSAALARALAGVGLLALLVTGGGVTVSRGVPMLMATAPTAVSGTEATAVFRVADRTIRQVRYDDGGALRYTFRLTNSGRLPLTIRGLATDQPAPRLFSYRQLLGPDGTDAFRLGPGATEQVTLVLGMSGCESLSSRAGSLVTEVVIRTEQAAMFDDEVTVTLPEEVHTGSPREVRCPRATATSRPPG